MSEKPAYAHSKLALTMWSFGLAGKEQDLTVIAVKPDSLLNTEIAKETYSRSLEITGH
ncbi:hypothetical protein MWU78_09040 [Arenibacter sp. F26102]|uniref:hypothetical protein n=1 Tax=Arenibacter sp. F26102 TaxID=2926416 RepID=UPI001FF5F21F|nr:hypothetical protein [Arenibacter sp. F26102]MCK0145786.1 hypothetical protein [Arenibacter sp. F26102]